VIFILIPIAVLALALLGLSVCRVAAISDRKQAVALAEWSALSHGSEFADAPAERSREQMPFAPPSGPFRATG
jgi:hypothetical protein